MKLTLVMAALAATTYAIADAFKSFEEICLENGY